MLGLLIWTIFKQNRNRGAKSMNHPQRWGFPLLHNLWLFNTTNVNVSISPFSIDVLVKPITVHVWGTSQIPLSFKKQIPLWFRKMMDKYPMTLLYNRYGTHRVIKGWSCSCMFKIIPCFIKNVSHIIFIREHLK